MPLSAAVRLPWVGIATNAIIAVTRPSHSTLAGTGIAQSARPMHERGGSAGGNKSCCQPSYVLLADMWRSVMAQRLEALAVDFETT
jgi:hypothetical protein